MAKYPTCRAYAESTEEGKEILAFTRKFSVTLSTKTAEAIWMDLINRIHEASECEGPDYRDDPVFTGKPEPVKTGHEKTDMALKRFTAIIVNGHYEDVSLSEVTVRLTTDDLDDAENVAGNMAHDMGGKVESVYESIS
jgi:hypothetical protein